jgi:hypothetical protein
MKSVNVSLCGIVVLVSVIFGILGLLELNSLAQFGYRLSYEEGVAFSNKQLLVIVASLGGAFCGGFGLILCEKRRKGAFMKVAATGSVSLSLVGLAILFISPGNLGVHSIRSAMNECVNNLRAIDKAKEEWALRNAATNGTEVSWEQITNSFPKGFPVCPEGGKYELGKVGEPVTCPNPNHRIPSH